MAQDKTKPSNNLKSHPWAHLDETFKPIIAKFRGEAFSPIEFDESLKTVIPEIELSAEIILISHHRRNAKELARDATQNWLFKMFYGGGIKRYNECHPFYRYSYSVLYWICLGREFGDWDRRVTALGFDLEDDRQNPVRDVTAEDTADKVREAVSGLPPNQREAVVLKYWVEANLSEVARERGESGNALHIRACRGRAALRGQFANLDWK